MVVNYDGHLDVMSLPFFNSIPEYNNIPRREYRRESAHIVEEQVKERELLWT